VDEIMQTPTASLVPSLKSILQYLFQLLQFPFVTSTLRRVPPLSPLPCELVDAIITEAWWTAGRGRNRWGLYETLSAVSRTWRRLTKAAAFRIVFIECSFDFRIYIILIKRHLASLGSVDSDVYHHALFKNSHICAMYYYSPGQRSMPDVAQLILDARSMEVSIRVTRDENIDCLLANRPSLTHLRLCWPPAYMFNDDGDQRPLCSTIHSVTHLHIPRHPQYSLNSILALFPSVTHLRLSTQCFLKDIVPNTRKLEVLTLDAPPNYAMAGQYFSSLRFWNITSALNKGLLRHGDRVSHGRIVVNTGSDLPDGWQQASDACAKHHIYLERREIYTRTLVEPQGSLDHWAYGQWH